MKSTPTAVILLLGYMKEVTYMKEESMDMLSITNGSTKNVEVTLWPGAVKQLFVLMTCPPQSAFVWGK